MHEEGKRVGKVIKDALYEAQREHHRRELKLKRLFTAFKNVFTNMPNSVLESLFNKLDKEKLYISLAEGKKLKEIIKESELDKYLEYSWSLQIIELTSVQFISLPNLQESLNRKVIHTKGCEPFVLIKENDKYNLFEREDEIKSLFIKGNVIVIRTWIAQK